MSDPNAPDEKQDAPTPPPEAVEDAVPEGQADYGSAGQQAAEGVDGADR